MAEHAPLAPSDAGKWGWCSGAPAAQAGIPDVETESNRIGTAGHWVMAECLDAHRARAQVGLTCAEYIGRTAENGVVIDEAMAEGAQVMVDTVLAVCDKYDALDALLVEHRVKMPQIHEHNWGTLDAGLYLRSRGLLYIWDYKAGHRDVQPKGDLQLIDYVAGLVERYSIDGSADQHITVVIVIVQPFCYHARGPVKEWRVALSDLRAYFNQLRHKAEEAFTAPKLSAGAHCRDCKALLRCPAARKTLYNFIDVLEHPFELDAMAPRDLAVEREILKKTTAVAAARLEAVEQELQHRVEQGDRTAGLAIGTTRGREKWAVPEQQVLALFQQFGVDVSKNAVLTPAQALKKVPAEQRPFAATVIKKFTQRSTALTLVQADDSVAALAFKPQKAE